MKLRFNFLPRLFRTYAVLLTSTRSQELSARIQALVYALSIPQSVISAIWLSDIISYFRRYKCFPNVPRYLGIEVRRHDVGYLSLEWIDTHMHPGDELITQYPYIHDTFIQYARG